MEESNNVRQSIILNRCDRYSLFFICIGLLCIYIRYIEGLHIYYNSFHILMFILFGIWYCYYNYGVHMLCVDDLTRDGLYHGHRVEYAYNLDEYRGIVKRIYCRIKGDSVWKELHYMLTCGRNISYDNFKIFKDECSDIGTLRNRMFSMKSDIYTKRDYDIWRDTYRSNRIFSLMIWLCVYTLYIITHYDIKGFCDIISEELYGVGY